MKLVTGGANAGAAAAVLEMRKELNTMVSVSPHPNVLRLLGACTSPDSPAVRARMTRRTTLSRKIRRSVHSTTSL